MHLRLQDQVMKKLTFSNHPRAWQKIRTWPSVISGCGGNCQASHLTSKFPKAFIIGQWESTQKMHTFGAVQVEEQVPWFLAYQSDVFIRYPISSPRYRGTFRITCKVFWWHLGKPSIPPSRQKVYPIQTACEFMSWLEVGSQHSKWENRPKIIENHYLKAGDLCRPLGKRFTIRCYLYRKVWPFRCFHVIDLPGPSRSLSWIRAELKWKRKHHAAQPKLVTLTSQFGDIDWDYRWKLYICRWIDQYSNWLSWTHIVQIHLIAYWGTWLAVGMSGIS